MARVDKEFGHQVTAWMRAAKLSTHGVEERAAELGHKVTHATVGKLQRGTIPGTDKLRAVGAALGQDPDVFVARARGETVREVTSDQVPHEVLVLWGQLSRDDQKRWIGLGNALLGHYRQTEAPRPASGRRRRGDRAQG